MFVEDKTTEFQREYADDVRNTAILLLRKMVEDGLLRKIGRDASCAARCLNDETAQRRKVPAAAR